jgi:hypothetical protein
VTSDPMESEGSDRSDGDKHGEEHNGDKPGGSIGCFWRGLGDPKGVNEDICEIKERFHGFIKTASSTSKVHLFLKYAFAYGLCACRCVGGGLH